MQTGQKPKKKIEGEVRRSEIEKGHSIEETKVAAPSRRIIVESKGNFHFQNNITTQKCSLGDRMITVCYIWR